MQRFAAFDIDQTLYAGTLAHDFVIELINHGVIPSDLEEVQKYFTNTSDEALVNALQQAQSLGQMSFKDYVQVGIDTAVSVAINTNRAVYDLMHKAWAVDGMTTIAISTSPYAVVKPFCDNVGPFEFVIAPMAQNIDGFVGPRSIIRASERTKGEWLQGLIDLFGFVLKDSIAIGDSATDISMLELVERPIAYRPTPELRQVAEARAWEIWN
ncbi:haloacid dehalogenase-like hydrolase [Candidatus Saccharibacteria bacterium]|nr:haloacid dehalogenase-like hydrolase [Candidatus Saccharibacteria bacterium]MCB9821338.1 haloacid dehalogenase-like hydrolase [Candidatus Nomurabacteria bacterium]